MYTIELANATPEMIAAAQEAVGSSYLSECIVQAGEFDQVVDGPNIYDSVKALRTAQNAADEINPMRLGG